MKLYRQGDVLVMRIEDAPKELGPRVPRDKGRIVLAYGEVTFHSHAIKSREAALYELPPSIDRTADGDSAWLAAQRFLKVRRPVDLVHEEHATIRLHSGNYRVIRQREYQPESLRLVAD